MGVWNELRDEGSFDRFSLLRVGIAVLRAQVSGLAPEKAPVGFCGGLWSFRLNRQTGLKRALDSTAILALGICCRVD